MSSEEMRIELERFVNTGLQEGWTGWPRHDGRNYHRAKDVDRRGLSSTFTGALSLSAASLRVGGYPYSSLQFVMRSN